MKRKALFTAVCVLASVAIAFGLFEWRARQIHIPPSLCHIGTFNLHNLPTNDEDRIKKIAQIITAKDLQVVALQEVGEASLEELKKELQPYHYDHILTPQTVNRHVAVLYQPERVSIACEKPCTLDLHDQEHPQLRDALLVNGRLLPNGFDFTLVVVHLIASPDDKKWRQEQLGTLHEWIIDRLENGDEQDIILAGDFNTPFLMKQEDFEILDGGMGFYIVQQDAGEDLYSEFSDKTYGSPVDFLIISPDCRTEYIDNTASFASYTSEAEKDLVSDHRLAWAAFSSDDLDDPSSTPLVTSDSALKLNVPKSVQRGNEITVKATTFPKAECTIRVLYPSGSKPQTSPRRNDKKEFVWTWRTSGNTTPGVATVQVQARWEWGHALAVRTFEITSEQTFSTGTQASQ